MAPAIELDRRDTLGPTRSAAPMAADILEAWAQGFNFGALIVLALFVLCNYRKRVLLHKLIMLELVLALGHATFIFFPNPTYDWYLPITATLLFISYQVHNFVSYFKIRLFLPKWGQYAFIGTLLLVQPYWVVETYASYAFWRRINTIQVYTRPMEPLFRDPWWIFTTCWLLYQIKSKYHLTSKTLLKISPRFSVMIACMILSIGFQLADIIVTLRDANNAEGVNPYWRIALVFKIAADTIFLDDFKSVLDKIMAFRSGSTFDDNASGGSVPPIKQYEPQQLATSNSSRHGPSQSIVHQLPTTISARRPSLPPPPPPKTPRHEMSGSGVGAGAWSQHVENAPTGANALAPPGAFGAPGGPGRGRMY